LHPLNSWMLQCSMVPLPEARLEYRYWLARRLHIKVHPHEAPAYTYDLVTSMLLVTDCLFSVLLL
jgi:hypothetical protein